MRFVSCVACQKCIYLFIKFVSFTISSLVDNVCWNFVCGRVTGRDWTVLIVCTLMCKPTMCAFYVLYLYTHMYASMSYLTIIKISGTFCCSWNNARFRSESIQIKCNCCFTLFYCNYFHYNYHIPLPCKNRKNREVKTMKTRKKNFPMSARA